MSSTSSHSFFRGIRFQLTLVYSTLFGLFLCAFAYIISNQYFQSGREDFDSGLINFAIDLSDYLSEDKSGLVIKFNLPPSEIKKDFPFILNQTFYSVRSLEGHIIAKSSKDPGFGQIPYDAQLAKRPDYTHRFLTFVHGKDKWRAVNLKITSGLGHKMIFQVASSLTNLEQRERYHMLVTTFMVPFLILCSSVFSFLIAGNALGPIKKLTDAANNIAAKNLSLRVPEANTGDEIEELSKTLNNLLARLEKSFLSQENFVANASHQLNTPLSIIKGELDVLETKTRSDEEIKRFHVSLREELGRLIELVKNMLLISRVDAGKESFVFNSVGLDELLVGITSRLTPKTREKKIALRFNMDESLALEDLEVMGEKQLLDSLFENILDNAIKYAPESSSVLLDIKRVDGRVEVWIQDEGPGIDPKEYGQIVSKRYQRGTLSNVPGTGIGLSIAHKIAEYHHANIIYVRVKPHGSLFRIQF